MNINRANIRRTIREMEEANQPVEPMLKQNLAKIEIDIQVLKGEPERIMGLTVQAS